MGGLMKVISSHIGATLDRNLGKGLGKAPANLMNMIIGVRMCDTNEFRVQNRKRDSGL